MPEIVGIRFKPVAKVYYFDPGNCRDLAENDPVVVETARGEELGWVNISLRMVPDEEIKEIRFLCGSYGFSAIDFAERFFKGPVRIRYHKVVREGPHLFSFPGAVRIFSIP